MSERYELKLSTHGRYEYSAIVHRPNYTWPQGRRLAVYLGLNLEHFAFGEGLGAELAPGGPQPDVLNYAWRDYGNRVGVWRLLSLFEALGLPVALLANSTLYNYCPEVIAAFRDRNDEIVAHGRTKLQVALDYIESHRETVEAGYQQVRQESNALRLYYEERNRERIAQIATLPPPPGMEAAWEKLQTAKARHQVQA